MRPPVCLSSAAPRSLGRLVQGAGTSTGSAPPLADRRVAGADLVQRDGRSASPRCHPEGGGGTELHQGRGRLCTDPTKRAACSDHKQLRPSSPRPIRAHAHARAASRAIVHWERPARLPSLAVRRCNAKSPHDQAHLRRTCCSATACSNEFASESPLPAGEQRPDLHQRTPDAGHVQLAAAVASNEPPDVDDGHSQGQFHTIFDA
mmetsp:Transcript_11216/g.35731  ORF Transcript_11216/g.35731 Transcript_11216/m.35731 type:complete len:205 (-) Transcript_11216:61-675(-)